jgi:hypothetical protein
VSDAGLTEQTPRKLRALRIAPDANVFTDYAYTERLRQEAQRGLVQIFWSPKTLEEGGRVRLWIWIKRTLRREPPPTGSARWKALWARYSEEAHAWFARLSPLVQVVEDQPLDEPAWADPHPDPNDAWLWNAARRLNADVVVTMNLSDAPPSDTDGSRHHEGIIYLHPTAFTVLLDAWAEILTRGVNPPDLPGLIRDAASLAVSGDATVLATQLQMLLDRLVSESA